MDTKQYEEAFKVGYEKAMQDVAHSQWKARLQRANEDLTGQDLDDFIERTHEPDNYDHVECPIQQAELRFGC
jgi:hypothetical protein